MINTNKIIIFYVFLTMLMINSLKAVTFEEFFCAVCTNNQAIVDQYVNEGGDINDCPVYIGANSVIKHEDFGKRALDKAVENNNIE